MAQTVIGARIDEISKALPETTTVAQVMAYQAELPANDSTHSPAYMAVLARLTAMYIANLEYVKALACLHGPN